MDKEKLKGIASILVVLALVFFCGRWLFFSDKTDDKQKTDSTTIHKELKQKSDLEDSLLKQFNGEQAEKLKSKYNLVADPRTNRRKFLAGYQDIFKDTTKYLNFHGEVTDIIEVDGKYILKLSGWGTVLRVRNLDDYDDFIADVNITTNQYEQFNKVINDTTVSLMGDFILRVNKITLLNPKIQMDAGEKGDVSSQFD